MENNRQKELYKSVCDIKIAFYRLIGPLSIMSILDSYKEAHFEIKELLDIITSWAAQFESKQTLSFISREELLNVYNRLDKLNDRFLFDTKLENENELSDEIVVWMWEIMELRKKQIKGEMN